ncbi:MAG: hypothetical protein Q8L82_11705 [Nitrosomonas sp.]|nr:hypothetical protein [Nitrosomonas sp.]
MSNETDQKIQRAHKRKLLVIMALLLAPVAISYSLYFFEYRPASTNYGELIEFQTIKGIGLNQADNTIFRPRDLQGKWVMISVDSGNCDEACKTKLYHMRQVRLVQNKEMHRVERVWLIDDDEPYDTALVDAYKGTIFINAKESEILESFKPIESQRKHIYLVDPMGNVMMRFPENENPSLMVNDLKRLLHLSQMEH